MTLAIRLLAEPVRTVTAATIAGAGGAYTGIGTSLANPARLVFFQNYTDQTVMFSFDGINDHFPLPANGFLLMDVTTNKTLPQGCFISEGQRFYVRELSTAPTENSIYLSVFYGANGNV